MLIIRCFLTLVGTFISLKTIIYYKKYFISPKAREFLDMGEHAKKIIPSMGGLVFYFILPISYFLLTNKYEFWFIVLGAGLSGLVGLFDDIHKIKTGKGIQLKLKFFLQALCAFVIGFYYWYFFPSFAYIQFFSYQLPPGPFFIFWVAWVVMSTTHAVNLTDGIDGLAISQTLLILLLVPFSQFFSFSLTLEKMAIFIFSLFAWQNKYPAKIIMGDVGAFFIGGFLASIFILKKSELLLISCGVVFVLNTMTCIIQILSFRFRGQKFFLFTPYHHALEIKKYSENQIVFIFSMITIFGCCLTKFFYY